MFDPNKHSSSYTRNVWHLLLAPTGFLNAGLEELVTEEVQGTNKDNSGVVASLKGSYQQCATAHSHRELLRILLFYIFIDFQW